MNIKEKMSSHEIVSNIQFQLPASHHFKEKITIFHHLKKKWWDSIDF